MKMFDGLNVFELAKFSYKKDGFNSVPVIEIFVNKNANVTTDVESDGDKVVLVNKPVKEYLEKDNHFDLFFKSIGNFFIYSKNSSPEAIEEINFLYDVLAKHRKATVKLNISLIGDSIKGDAAAEAFLIVFSATINQWAVNKI